MKKVLHFGIVLLWVAVAGNVAAQSVTPPEEFFGFRMGSDFKLADWPQIVEYFRLLDSQSNRIRVVELGKSTRGNPFIMAILSSEENLSQMDRYRELARRLASGTGFSEAALEQAVEQGRAIALVTCSIHATEVGGTQSSPELAFKLITENTERIRKIRENVIVLLVPSFNPDGLRMVKEWYDRYLQTPYEGSRMPWLYHYYTGHDNNRDAFMLTQVESRLVNRVLYHEWFPQIHHDLHQMGNRAARMFVPPYYDPLNPNLDPLLVREISLVGMHMATSLQEKGKKGVITNAMFTHWWQGGFLRTAWFHNVIGILSEAASARIASPIFQRKSDLQAGFKGLQEYRPTVNFPDPWEGGWWRLRDIVEYDLEATLSLLEFTALYKKDILRNFYRMASRAIEKGKTEPPFAYVIPPDQWDVSAASRLIRTLLLGGVTVHQARKAFEADGVRYPAGTYVIQMAQPYRAYAMDLLGPQKYPDIREYKGGPPLPPYDNAGWTLPYQMHVKAIRINHPFEAEMVKVGEPAPVATSLPEAKYGYLVDARNTDGFWLVNRALEKGFTVYRSSSTLHLKGKAYLPGAFIFPKQGSGLRKLLEDALRQKPLKLVGLETRPKGLRKLRPVKLGVYQPWLASMHEGWSRWLLEQYGFRYRTVHNDQIRSANLRQDYDVIYFPDIRARGILEGRPQGTAPPAYTGGIGAAGLQNLKKFVEQGGVLILMDAACEVVLKEFGLPVVDVSKSLKRSEFFCPGSILAAEFNHRHPLGYGMPPRGAVAFSRSKFFKIIPSFEKKADIIAKYPGKHLLLSGYLLGENKIANRVAMVDVPYGKGHVVLIGFDAINRGQAHGTFKLFFNAIYLAGLR